MREGKRRETDSPLGLPFSIKRRRRRRPTDQGLLLLLSFHKVLGLSFLSLSLSLSLSLFSSLLLSVQVKNKILTHTHTIQFLSFLLLLLPLFSGLIALVWCSLNLGEDKKENKQRPFKAHTQYTRPLDELGAAKFIFERELSRNVWHRERERDAVRSTRKEGQQFFFLSPIPASFFHFSSTIWEGIPLFLSG